MSYNKETGMYEGYIYKATCKISNKSYIGQTITTISNRRSGHYYNARNNYDNFAFHNAIRKYGEENFVWVCLHKEFADNKDNLYKKLNKLEIFEISELKTISPNGYNIDAGGNSSTKTCRPVDCYDLYGNYIMSFDSCSEAARYVNGNNTIIINCLDRKIKTAYGYVWVDLGSEFIKPTNNKSLTPVDCYSLDGEFIKSFSSIVEAAEFVGSTKATNISNCINGFAHMAYGYRWANKGEQLKNRINSNIKPVDCYDTEMNFIKTYLGGVKEAAEDINGNPNAIKQCCLGKTNTSSGYIWKYHIIDKYANKKRPVFCYSLNGDFLKKYNSAEEASKDMSCSISGIYSCARKNIKSYAGYIWTYEYKSKLEKIVSKYKKINCYSKNYEYINTFDNGADASRFANLDRSRVGTNLKNGNNKAGSYYWYYADDPNQPDKSKIIA